MEISTEMQLGIGMSTLGLAFICLGVVMLFDRGLIAIGNLLFLGGLCLIIGFRRTFSFFIQWQRIRGTIAFFAGILILLMGHPIIGGIIEIIGFFLLFKTFIPTAFSYVTTFVPFFGSNVVRNRSIV